MIDESNNLSADHVFGLYPITAREQEQRRDDAFDLKVAFESRTTPEWSSELANAIDRSAVLFWNIARQSSNDWFSSSAQLSHPSPRLAGKIANQLRALKDQLEKDDIDGINTAMGRLEQAFLPQIVDQYLEVTRSVDPEPIETASGWVYLLKPLTSKLSIATTEGTIEETLASRDNFDTASIFGAWRVTDIHQANTIIQEVFAHRRLSGDDYAIKDMSDARELKNKLHEQLSANDLVVGNPFWAPTPKKQLFEIDVYSHDISNKKFESDVDSVFAAFRM